MKQVLAIACEVILPHEAWKFFTVEYFYYSIVSVAMTSISESDACMCTMASSNLDLPIPRTAETSSWPGPGNHYRNC